MDVYRSLAEVPANFGPAALTIGNFDGVHLGHQAMLKRLREAASARGCPAGVMTFEPHPREFFAPDQAPVRLTSLREKFELLQAFGVDRTPVLFMTFKRSVSWEHFPIKPKAGGSPTMANISS